MPSTWTAFVVLLCVATFMDNAVHTRMAWDALVHGTPIRDPVGVFVSVLWVLATVWTLVRPSSLNRYLGLCGVASAAILFRLPAIPNHWVFQLGVYLGSLLIAVSVRRPAERFEALRTLIFGAVFVLYGWAIIHKLNAGFLDPATSCGPTFVERLAARLALSPPPDQLRAGTVGAVLVAEAAMPLLLSRARLRPFAILLGIGLHLMFGLFIPGFSLLVWAMYFSLLAPTALDPMLRRVEHARSRLAAVVPARVRNLGVPGPVGQAIKMTLIVALILLIKDVPTFRGLPPRETLFLPLAAVIIPVLVWGLWASGGKLVLVGLQRRSLALALLFPLLLAANGAVPYFGIRNVLAFSMFSNLHTEGGRSNHLFLPNVASRFSVLDDQIRVLESSDPVMMAYALETRKHGWNWTSLVAEGQKAYFDLPFFMLRYRADELRRLEQPMFSIKFDRGGEVFDWSPEQVGELTPVGRLASWAHWSKGTPRPPHENLCMW